MPPILDVALGLVFVFLVFSLVVSALNELILSTLDKRADFLEEALGELLADRTKEKGGAVETFLSHGLVDSLSRKADGKPSYLPPKVFVSALLDQISKADVDTERTMNDIKAKIKTLPNPKLKESLTAIVADAGEDLASFKAGIEGWFNQSMERVSGWYKRYSQKWMFWLGLGLAIACNLDSVHLIQALSSDSKLRDSMVAQAVKYAKEHAGLPNAKTEDSHTQASAQQSTEVIAKLDKFENSLATMNSTGMPIGWGNTQIEYFKNENGRPDLSRVLLAPIGWLITALACTLGAPFWFDTLNRFINVRGNGRPPKPKTSLPA